MCVQPLEKSFLTYTESTQLSCIVLGYKLDDWGFEFWQGLVSSLFITTSRLALETTQPPIQWVPGPLSLGVKWLGC